MRILVFEDRRVDRLYPSSCARPAYALTCAGETLADGLSRLGAKETVALVRPHLQAVASVERPDWRVSSGAAELSGEGPTLFVNARIAPTSAAFRRLAKIVSEGKDCVHFDDDEVVLPPNLPRRSTRRASATSFGWRESALLWKRRAAAEAYRRTTPGPCSSTLTTSCGITSRRFARTSMRGSLAELTGNSATACSSPTG
jgi:hypothetical protein